jgi:NADPH-dependent 2,4-dienoyl-CoA reductase/sulfur reductase-like enzyme
VRFKDGTEVPADLVVMAVGIRPNVGAGAKMRLHVNRGIVVSDTMQTVTDARIYAVGECAAHRGVAYGLVAPLFEQGKVVANHLASSASGATGLAHVHQAQGHGHRSVLGRRLHGRRGHRGDRDERPLWRASTKSWCSRTTSWWAPACMATPWTAAGTSSCCATVAA